jgi:Domain of unknown function (DUF5666)
MRNFWAIGFPVLAGLWGIVGVHAQTTPNAAGQRIQVPGAIISVDASAGRLSVKADNGHLVTVSVSGRTLILHIPPGETDPKKGTKLPFAELVPGDRVVAMGRQGTGEGTLEATALLVMTKADLAQIRQKEIEDWRRRGTTGMVTAIDAAAKTLTIKAGSRTFTVQPSDGTDYRRYSPDSAKFSDATPSSFAEIKVDDQVKVLGNKNEDGSIIHAEKLYFGSFRQIAATIKSIDPAAGEIVVTDLASKKPLTVRVDADTTMRKLPPMMAAMLARRYRPGGGFQHTAAGPEGGTDGVRGAGGMRGPGGMRGAGNGDIGQMLDRLPALQLTELKPGDAIMVSTTQGSDPARVSAITLLAGVEPLLTASPSTTRDIMSGWNLGGAGGEEGDQ